MATVIDPAPNELSQRSRTKINEKLTRIKQELLNESLLSQHESSDEDDDCSQILPQQFYADLDEELKGLPRETYITGLLRYCAGDFNKIKSYRERLAERAKANPGCPTTRLVNRRTTQSSSRDKKYATDCYILQAYVNGERTKDIYDVFSTSTQNPVTIEDDAPQNDVQYFAKPDIYCSMNKILTVVNEIARQQASDSFTLQQMQTDINSIHATYTRFQGSLNRIMALLPRDLPEMAKSLEQLRSDVSRLDSAIATANIRLLEKDVPTHKQTITPSTKTVELEKNKSFAEIVVTPINDISQDNKQDETTCKQKIDNQNSERENDVNVSQQKKNTNKTPSGTRVDVMNKTKTDTKQIKDNTKDNTLQLASHTLTEPVDKNKDKTNAGKANKFIAVRRKFQKSTSFFVGNIDPSVEENDITDFLQQKGVHVKRLILFHGPNGSSARLIVYPEDVETVESESFWPEKVTIRRWMNKSEWEEHREEQSYRRNNRDRYYAKKDSRSTMTRKQRNNNQQYKYDHSDDKYDEDNYNSKYDDNYENDHKDKGHSVWDVDQSSVQSWGTPDYE